MTFSDPLPVGGSGSLIVNPTFTVTDSAGQVTAANFVLDGNQTIGYTLRTANGADFDMAVDANRTITIQVAGNLANSVVPGQVVVNNAETRWTSLPGDVGNLTIFNGNGTERTGAGGINDYIASDQVDLQVANPLIFKRIVATSANATTDPSRVVIGEIVRYRVVVAVPEAGNTTYVINDQLAPGLQYLGNTALIALVEDAANAPLVFTSSTIGPNPAAYQSGNETNITTIVPTFAFAPTVLGNGTIQFDLGVVQNLDPNNDAEFFVFEYNALVLNVGANQDNPNTSLPNNASVIVNGNVTGSASTLVRVAEPSITDLTKQAFQALPDPLALTPDNASHDAGDRVRFAATYSNAVGANVSTAYDVRLQDTLPGAKMTLAAGSVRVLRNGAEIVSGFTVNTGTPNKIDVVVDVVNPGDAITVIYDAVLTTNVRAGEVVTNTADLTYTSLPGDNGPLSNPTGSATPGTPGNQTGERTGAGGINDYSDTALASITITAPDLSKNILTTSIDQTASDQFDPNLVDLAIGESVTYRLTITVPEGTSTLLLTDLLPTLNEGTLDFISANVVSIGAKITGNALAPGAPGTFSGNTVTFNFGNMVLNTPNNVVNAGDQIVVDIRGRVNGNRAENVGGDKVGNNATTLNNVATLDYSFGNVTDNAVAEIVEPRLQIDKTVIGNTTYDAGNGANGTPNNITYQLVVNHTANSSAAAFDLTIADAIPSGLTYVANSATVLSGNATIVNNASNLTVTSPELGLTGNITIRFQAYVNSTVAPGGSVVNTSTVDYDTAPGITIGQRNANASDTATVTLFTNSISGEIYVDANNNGLRDGNEALILGNITLELSGTDHLGCAVSANVTTANGTYSFLNLRPGTYQVEEITQPTAFLDGRDTPGNSTAGFPPFGGTGTAANATRAPRDSETIGNITIALGGNKAGTSYNFGEIRAASIGDFVWEDRDGNGRQDGAEPGIGNITVNLTGTDDTGAAVSNSTQTAANGAYTFAGLRPGNYTVAFGNSSGTANYFYTTQNSPVANAATNSDGNQTTGNTALITLGVGDNNANIDQGLYLPVTIGDTVFYDINGNGTQDSGEPGIGNVTVRLYYDANFDGNITGTEATTPFATQATLANGAYLFANLQPGTYRVDVNTGTLPNGLTANTTATSQNTGLLLSNQTDLARDFGFRGTGTIGDRIYLDTNGDGNQATNGTEPNLPGVTVTLTWHGFDGQLGGSDDITYNTVTTNPANSTAPNYLFGNLPTGNFTVSVPTPGAGGVPDNAVLTDAVDNGNLNASSTANTTLTSGNLSNLTLDFGFRGTASIGDNVWYDVDGSATRNNAEPGIANAAVTLEWGGADGNLATSADNVVYNTTTDANGNYLFANLPVIGAGSPYRVSVTPPACFVTQTFDSDGLGTANQSTLTLGPNEANLAQDFGYRGNLAQGLGNFVWEDRNGNGRQDGTEPGIGNVTVNLFDSTGASLLATTTTDGNGAYSFTGLIAGNYAVQFGDVPGFVRTVPNSAVANEATDSDANVATGNTGPVTVSAGAINNDVDAGYYQPINIGDLVWIDFDGDQTQDPGEPGIANANVTVTWYGPDGAPGGGDDANFSTSTDGNGAYGIANLPPGNYGAAVTGLPGGLTIQTRAPNDGGGNNTFTLTSNGGNRSDIDFGFRGVGAIGDRVFLDANNNGLPEAFEGIGNVTVRLFADLDGDGTLTLLTSTVTSGNGAYLFSGLPATANGVAYRVEVDTTTLPLGADGNAVPNTVDPDGGNNSMANLTLTSAAPSNLAQDFGYRDTSLGIIGDTIFLDFDGDNTADPGEGIGNVTVLLFVDRPGNGTFTPAGSTQTASDGTYFFTGLPTARSDGSPLTYSVRVAVGTLPPNVVNTFDPDGGNDSQSLVRLDAGNTTPSSTTPSAGVNIGQDFGYQGNNSLAGFVYSDGNNNGQREPGLGEIGIGNVTITLTGADLTGNTYSFSRAVTTDANGAYFFGNLPTGNWTITQTQPPNFEDGIDTPGNVAGVPRGTSPMNDVLQVSLGVQGVGESGIEYNFGEQGADLELIKSVTPETQFIGLNVTYEYIINNRGPSTAIGVVVVDPFPPGLQFVTAFVPTQGTVTYANGVVTWNVGDMPNGAQERLQVVARVTRPGPIVNSAAVGSVSIDPDLSNNPDNAIISGQYLPPPLISKRYFLTTSQLPSTPDSFTVSGPAALRAAGPSLLGGAAASLTAEQLRSTVAASLELLAQAGVNSGTLARLGATQFQIGNLPGNTLGLAYLAANRITIDDNAAGHGWFVDPTPFLDEEFAGGVALPGGPAAGKMDLLSAVLHELGHQAGFDHGDDFMSPLLAPGARTLGALDAFFAQAPR